ncbi:MAG: thiamine-phosphate kinase [Deltaproteobacteria bacterium]|jgi:thiamine-monophosphate kinase|nr:thiamine-phosphate kinase [Deltaproteobacteria bacterium]
MPAPFSENAILACVDKYFAVSHPSLLLARGDDCAVLRPSGPLCLSTDLFLEDVHFRRSYFTPREIGHKALAVNASDLAACGAKPLAFTLSLGLPPDVGLETLDGLFAGMSALAERLRMGLAGGDLSRADKLCLSITAWGEGGGRAGTGRHWLSRSGAQPGEVLFLIGDLGLARTGFELLEAEGRKTLETWPAACAAHLVPQPQVDAGQILSRLGQADHPPVLMDLSDGLARDLPRLLGLPHSGLGAELLIPEAMLHQELVRYARGRGREPVREAYLGGEDYALLGACIPQLLSSLHAALPELREIGTVTDSGDIRLNGALVGDDLGFDHFK